MNLKPPKPRQPVDYNKSKRLHDSIRTPSDGMYQLAKAIQEQAAKDHDVHVATIWQDIIACYEEFK